MSDTYPVLATLHHTLIVSCQAEPHEPLHGPEFMAAMARAAKQGGASAIRASGPVDVAAIRAAVDLPILGIYKQRTPGYEVFITPTFESAREVVAAGAAIVALEASALPRPGGETLSDLIRRIHAELGVPVMADCSCMEDALLAQAAGADWIGTTLAGYTKHGRPTIDGPDLDFISELARRVEQPIIAEGRFHAPEQVREAFARGAFAIVIGGAITRPQEITRRFAAALPG